MTQPQYIFYTVQLMLFSSRRLVSGFTINNCRTPCKSLDDSLRIENRGNAAAAPTSILSRTLLLFQNKKENHINSILFADLVDEYGGVAEGFDTILDFDNGGESEGDEDVEVVEEVEPVGEETESAEMEEERVTPLDPYPEPEPEREPFDMESDETFEDSIETNSEDVDAYGGTNSKDLVDALGGDRFGIKIDGNSEITRETNYDYSNDDYYEQNSYRDNSSTGTDRDFPFPRCTNIEPQQIVSWNENKIPASTVALVTQCSLDRLDRLKQQIRAWNGYASIVIYVSSLFFRKSRKDEIMREFQSDGRVAVTIVHNNNWNGGNDPYPINYLRNIALLQAREQYARGEMGVDDPGQLSVFLVDVDFVPSLNLQAALHAKEAQEALEDEVVVIPAFETLSKGLYLPSDMEELQEFSESGQLEGFHMEHFPKGHGGTDFDKFWALSKNADDVEKNIGNLSSLWNKTYKVQHSEGFEPYIVMAADKVPLYDERFQGYGLNKISHLDSVAATVSSTFTVLPGAFLVAVTHERSKEWRRIYGDDDSTSNSRTEKEDLKSNLRALYKEFLQRLNDGEGPAISETTSTRLKLLNTTLFRKTWPCLAKILRTILKDRIS